MEARELRVGNLIWWCHEEDESEVVVTAGVIRQLEAYKKDRNADEFARGLWYAPIPLTEEWLLRMGFSNKEYKDGYIGIDVGNTDFALSYPSKDPEDFKKNFYFEFKYGGWPRIKIFDTVHELQNFFYALTGTELTIK